MISSILSILAAALTIYTILCFIYIIMSWFPGLRFTAFGKFITSACEPYMNLFSRRGWLRFGNIDFSPIISIGLLSLASSILGGIQASGRIYFGGIIATILSMIWNIASSLLTILLLLVFVRWIVLIINKNQTSYDSGWNQIDSIINKFTYNIARTFTKNSFSYRKSLLISWIAIAVVLFAGNILFRILATLCFRLPF